MRATARLVQLVVLASVVLTALTVAHAVGAARATIGGDGPAVELSAAALVCLGIGLWTGAAATSFRKIVGSPMSASSDAVLADEERRALDVYNRLVRPALRPGDDGKYVAIAFEADDFEVDADDYAATGRLLARHPGARIWLMQAGEAAAYRVRGTAADRP